ncbi:efflux RND transporter permease subunit [bacterium]|nr:efflux RND transporter permease subunit [bacterium]
MIQRIIDYTLSNKIIVIAAALILVAAGVRVLSRLPVDVYPDLNAPVVNVLTESHGMAPEDIETLITFPLETAFNSLPYVKRVSSNSALGFSKITIEFNYGTDIYFARQLVAEKLQMMTPQLPGEIEPPFIGPISSMFADAIEFTISGDDLYAIRDFAEWNLKPRLQTVAGVSNVIAQGGFLRQYHVLLDPNALLNHSLGHRDVVEALERNNRNSSGGFLLESAEEKLIRGMGRIHSLDDIRRIVLKTTDGVPLTIGDVAEVTIGAFVRRGTAGVGTREVVTVTVQNQYDANVMKTIRGVEQVLDEVREEIPASWRIEPYYNQVDMIRKSISNVTTSIFIGAFLVIFVLYLFLNSIRSTAVVALAIPLSAVFSFVFFRLFGLTVNIMTLGGLAIGLGMIVDSSIIMAENIHRHIQEGALPFAEAVKTGAREVGSPIFYAILILLSVFGPIFTLEGIEGRMFIPLTFAVSAAVLGSLIISLTITPVLASLLFRRGRETKPNRMLTALQTQYERLLRYAIVRPGRLLIVCGLLLAAGVGAYFFTGSEFMPELDESSLLVDILLPPETSLQESSRIGGLVTERIAELPEVVRVVRLTGKARGAEHTQPVNLTHANCVLVPKEKRHASIEKIKADIRRVTSGIPGVNISINAPLQHRINHVVTGIRAAVAVKIFGDNMGTILALAEEVRARMEGIEGVTDLQIEQISGVPQMQLRFRREKLARYGLNVDDMTSLVEIALNGKVATELIETHKRYDIFVRYQEKFRDDASKVANLLVQTPAGYRIPVSEVADIVTVANPSVIRRENALRRGVVQCNVAGRDMGSVVAEIKQKLEGLQLEKGYFITFGGTYENQMRAMKRLTAVVLATVAIVFLLLVLSFRSFRNGLLVIINIPLALAGGMLILLVSGHTLSVPSLVGFIALIGIAVQDGIVLVTHIEIHRRKNLPLTDAVLEAGRNKLRPVLMTTFTTMLGLVPLALRNVTGSELQKPLAAVIMFGLLFSTMLTLVVLPALYVASERNR